MIKTNLSDTSFLIPLRIDSEDRLCNIRIVLHYLRQWFHTQVYVYESDSTPKLGESLRKNIHYQFSPSKEPIFRRTEVGNRMIVDSQTPIVVLYDADVIVPAAQLLRIVGLIRQGECRAGLPYDGRFVEVDKYNKRLFGSCLDPGFLQDGNALFRINTYNSNGGCIVLDRRTYMNCGMENEHISGWGHEDAERVKRLETLGIPVRRTAGALYHLHHVRNRNSFFFDSKMADNSFETYFKTCASGREQLEAEISTWPWKK